MSDPRLSEPRSAAETRQTRAERHRRVVAAVSLSAFVVLVLAVWIVAMLDDGGSPSEDGSGDGVETDERTEAETSEPEAQGPEPTDDLGAEEPDEAENPDAEPELTSVVLDELCTVVIAAGDEEDDVSAIRAWDYAACTYAPVSLEEGTSEWIVVRASLNESDFSAQDAEQRAEDLEAEGGVLWSSHYPSLNPGLWVVYDGPFPDAEAAGGVAEDVGGGAYPRELTIDDDDRFCVAADDCVGERTD